MSHVLERIIQQVKTLSEPEQRQLAAILQGMNVPANGSSVEDETEAKLAAEGWLSLPVPPTSDTRLCQIASPLIVRGRPLSEILIEDRR